MNSFLKKYEYRIYPLGRTTEYKYEYNYRNMNIYMKYIYINIYMK